VTDPTPTDDDLLAQADAWDGDWPGQLIVDLAAEVRALRDQLNEAQLRSIEARNPGIDMDEVRRLRAAGRPPTGTPDRPAEDEDYPLIDWRRANAEQWERGDRPPTGTPDTGDDDV
jgi:hypothetical protein